MTLQCYICPRTWPFVIHHFRTFQILVFLMDFCHTKMEKLFSAETDGFQHILCWKTPCSVDTITGTCYKFGFIFQFICHSQYSRNTSKPEKCWPLSQVLYCQLASHGACTLEIVGNNFKIELQACDSCIAKEWVTAVQLLIAETNEVSL